MNSFLLNRNSLNLDLFIGLLKKPRLFTFKKFSQTSKANKCKVEKGMTHE